MRLCVLELRPGEQVGGHVLVLDAVVGEQGGGRRGAGAPS